MLIKQYLLLVKIANKNRNFWQKKKKGKRCKPKCRGKQWVKELTRARKTRAQDEIQARYRSWIVGLYSGET